METSIPRDNAQGSIPAASEHQAMKAVERPDVSSGGGWLSFAMALWLQDDTQQAAARTPSQPACLPR